jgi:hypothetical protein
MQKGIQILKKAALLLSSKRQWSNRVLQFFCKGACGDLLKLWVRRWDIFGKCKLNNYADHIAKSF